MSREIFRPVKRFIDKRYDRSVNAQINRLEASSKIGLYFLVIAEVFNAVDFEVQIIYKTEKELLPFSLMVILPFIYIWTLLDAQDHIAKLRRNRRR